MKIGVEIIAGSGPGVLHQLTGVIARHAGDILSIEIVQATPPGTRIVFEIELPGDAPALVTELAALTIVKHAGLVETMDKVYGKRIIIMDGGAQVGKVALGAITEADRHNIRGENISVDTIPLVGEQA